MTEIEPPLLLPAPQSLHLDGGLWPLPDEQLIIIHAAEPALVWPIARRAQAALRQRMGVHWSIVAAAGGPGVEAGLSLALVPGVMAHDDGYRLTVTEAGAKAVASTPAGLFYSLVTLEQLLLQYERALPLLQIVDWPDFPNRGVMLDISRDNVPTMDTLYQLVERFASWKINQLQLYTEHTFAYRRHPQVWEHASPMTGEEMMALDAFCRERFVELVPNQNSLGHMARWLQHEPYRELAECPEGVEVDDPIWAPVLRQPFTLCPVDERSLNLLRDLYDELLPHFSSRQFNIGGDEPMELGLCRSRHAVVERGRGHVYLDFLLRIYGELAARGRTMQFWGDVVVNHPELVSLLPRDILALVWGYEADHPFEDVCPLFRQAGLPFYVCPGTSSWNSVGGRFDNARINLRRAAAQGRAHNASGFLITDWGDNGHWQPLPVSYTGFAYGAALAWAGEANEPLDLAGVLDQFIFSAAEDGLGQLLLDIGMVHLRTGAFLENATLLFELLQTRPQQLGVLRGRLHEGELNAAALSATREELQRLRQRLQAVKVTDQRQDLLEADPEEARQSLVELAWVLDMLEHATVRGEWMLARERGEQPADQREHLRQEAERLLAGFRTMWRARNRRGGLSDSAERVTLMIADYAENGVLDA